MKAYLNRIRSINGKISVKRRILNTFCVFVFGIALGIFSKYLDGVPGNVMPDIIAYLDFGNFLSRFAIWIFIAVCISVYSHTPLRAGLNVFVFFAGMVGSYYWYSKYIMGFFPKSYAMIWVGFTLASLLPAFICWYAKGKGPAAVVISAGITAVLFNTAFAYGFWYFDVRYLLELLVFFAGIWVLRRNPKETAWMLALGIVFALVLNRMLHW